MVSEKLEYSKIFYGLSAFLGVLSVLYFGFEYIQDLSPLTISIIMFTVFLTAFLGGITRRNRGVKLVLYLISGGSYLAFLSYTNARLLTTSNQTLGSLILSAVFFSTLGYLMTEKSDIMPEKSTINRAIVVIFLLGIALVGYDIFLTGVEYSIDLEENVALQEGENTLGVLEIEKKGYLPVEVERKNFRTCIHHNGTTTGVTGIYTESRLTGLTPETSSEELEVNIRERMAEELGIDLGETYEIQEVESCREAELEEGVLGFSSGDDRPLRRIVRE